MESKYLFASHNASILKLKKELWGGQFWSDGYFVRTVGKNANEDVIAEYVKNQGKQDCGEYKQRYMFGSDP